MTRTRKATGVAAGASSCVLLLSLVVLAACDKTSAPSDATVADGAGGGDPAADVSTCDPNAGMWRQPCAGDEVCRPTMRCIDGPLGTVCGIPCTADDVCQSWGAGVCVEGSCDAAASRCESPDPCQPGCGDRRCGPDPFCGLSCGTCPTGEMCEAGTCGPCPSPVGVEQCFPSCAPPDCLPATCCGGMGCDSCTADQTCFEYRCCTPSCTPDTCGDDGCGGLCFGCPPPGACRADQCAPLDGWVRTIDFGEEHDDCTAAALRGDGLVVVGWNRQVALLSRSDGSTLWSEVGASGLPSSLWLDVARDDSGIYLAGVVGAQSEICDWATWVVSKRSDLGEALWDQEVTGPAGGGAARRLAAGPDGLYVTGDVLRCEEGALGFSRLEKRALDDGAVLWRYDWGPGPGTVQDVAADATGVYVALRVAFTGAGDPEPPWRIEKRAPADGELLWAQSEDAPMPYVLLVDAGGLYALGPAGGEAGGWRIEKRSFTDGALLSSTVVTSPGREPAGVAVRSGVLWIVGRSRQSWYVEQRRGDTGELLDSLQLRGHAGASDYGPRAITVDDAGVAVVGSTPTANGGWDSQWQVIYLGQ